MYMDPEMNIITPYMDIIFNLILIYCFTDLQTSYYSEWLPLIIMQLKVAVSYAFIIM